MLARGDGKKKGQGSERLALPSMVVPWSLAPARGGRSRQRQIAVVDQLRDLPGAIHLVPMHQVLPAVCWRDAHVLHALVSHEGEVVAAAVDAQRTIRHGRFRSDLDRSLAHGELLRAVGPYGVAAYETALVGRHLAPLFHEDVGDGIGLTCRFPRLPPVRHAAGKLPERR